MPLLVNHGMIDTIKHKENNTNGIFYLEKDHKIIAEMEYFFSGTQEITINHTDVKPELKGQGIGIKLLDAAAEYAEEKNLKIIPLCPFVEVQFSRSDKYDAVKG